MFGNFKLRKTHSYKIQKKKLILFIIILCIIYTFYDNTICAYKNVFFKFKKR